MRIPEYDQQQLASPVVDRPSVDQSGELIGRSLSNAAGSVLSDLNQIALVNYQQEAQLQRQREAIAEEARKANDAVAVETALTVDWPTRRGQLEDSIKQQFSQDPSIGVDRFSQEAAKLLDTTARELFPDNPYRQSMMLKGGLDSIRTQQQALKTWAVQKNVENVKDNVTAQVKHAVAQSGVDYQKLGVPPNLTLGQATPKLLSQLDKNLEAQVLQQVGQVAKIYGSPSASLAFTPGDRAVGVEESAAAVTMQIAVDLSNKSPVAFSELMRKPDNVFIRTLKPTDYEQLIRRVDYPIRVDQTKQKLRNEAQFLDLPIPSGAQPPKAGETAVDLRGKTGEAQGDISEKKTEVKIEKKAKIEQKQVETDALKRFASSDILETAKAYKSAAAAYVSAEQALTEARLLLHKRKSDYDVGVAQLPKDDPKLAALKKKQLDDTFKVHRNEYKQALEKVQDAQDTLSLVRANFRTTREEAMQDIRKSSLLVKKYNNEILPIIREARRTLGLPSDVPKKKEKK